MNPTLLALLCLSTFFTVHAGDKTGGDDGLPRLTATPPAKYWRTGDETKAEIWLLPGSDGALRLHGRDLASTFEAVVVAGEGIGAWECAGTGFRFDGGIAFAYRSTFTLATGAEGPVLNEVWTAMLPDGSKVEGESTYHPAEVDR